MQPRTSRNNNSTVPTFESLIEQLKSDDPGKRSDAARLLGQLRDTRATTALIRALGDDAIQVRGAAARALGEVGDGAAIPSLMAGLEDVSNWVRAQCAFSLGTLHALNASQQLYTLLATDQDLNVQGCAAAALSQMGAAGLHLLVQALASPRTAVRTCAAEALRSFTSEQVSAPLERSLYDVESSVRYAALESLAAIDRPQAVKHAYAALHDEWHGLRALAVEILAKERTDIAIAALIELLDDNNSYVLIDVVRELGEIGDSRAIPRLTNLLTAREWSDAEVASLVPEIKKAIENIRRRAPLEEKGKP